MIETNQDSLRDYWDNIKYTNIWIIDGTEKEKKMGVLRRYLKRI